MMLTALVLIGIALYLALEPAALQKDWIGVLAVPGIVLLLVGGYNLLLNMGFIHWNTVGSPCGTVWPSFTILGGIGLLVAAVIGWLRLRKRHGHDLNLPPDNPYPET